MSQLNTYFVDGTDPHIRATLAYLQWEDGLECSWNDKTNEYEADFRLARWHDGRRQGYVIWTVYRSFQAAYTHRLNCAFFNHKISDEIQIIFWDDDYYPNPPTIEMLDDEKATRILDSSVSFRYQESAAAAAFIWEKFSKWWNDRKGDGS